MVNTFPLTWAGMSQGKSPHAFQISHLGVMAGACALKITCFPFAKFARQNILMATLHSKSGCHGVDSPALLHQEADLNDSHDIHMVDGKSQISRFVTVG